ncbi:hypothetical protein AB0K12_41490 [Nonomuraea sp. NPDC049419]|uniref:hypothetical protein n=1 Tax=Nonomuraea sp. NPDC049419 TaxID=3155772 RepID=UPI00343FF553
MADNGTTFGSYLYRLRIERGSDTVADFLRDLVIPFTANYYRDVEAGRKLLSMEAAITLHAALGLGPVETADYFWHYFRDVLPAEIHELLFGRRTRVAEGSLAEINRRNADQAEMGRRALALARFEREFVADSAVTDSFQRDFDLLPVMTFVYMVSEASEAQVTRVCERLGVGYGPRVKEFLARISDVHESDGKLCYRRRAPVLRMPRDENGIALKNRFQLHEVARSVERQGSGEMFPPGGTFCYSAMVALPEEALDRVQRRLTDLLTEVEVASRAGGQLDNPSATPYFFSVTFSGRQEYDGRDSSGR